MPSAPLVSVIIPAYQAAGTIGDAIGSVLAQTYRSVEVLVIDDGSTDGTAAVAEACGHPTRCIRQDNAGDVVARNRGIESSAGELVSFLDADDLWLPTKLEEQIRALAADPAIGSVQCGAVFVDECLRALEVRPGIPGALTLWDAIRFRGLPALSSALMVRRACLERVGPIDVTVRGKDEWDLAIRLVRSCGLTTVARPLVMRRVHAASASRAVSYAERQIRPGLEILSRLFADESLPEADRRMRRAAYAAFYSMIAGSFLAAGRIDRAIAWSARAIITYPPQLGYVLEMPIRRIGRAWRRRVSVRGGLPFPDNGDAGA